MKEYTITELADRWGVTRVTVWRWYNDGHFEGAYRKGPGDTSPVVIPERDVLRFEAEHNLKPRLS